MHLDRSCIGRSALVNREDRRAGSGIRPSANWETGGGTFYEISHLSYNKGRNFVSSCNRKIDTVSAGLRSIITNC